MGFSFVVGAPIDVYTEEHAALVAGILRSRFGLSLSRQPIHRRTFGSFFPYRFGGGFRSDEMGSSWVEKLQSFAVDTIGDENVPHLLACDAWNSVFLPCAMVPEEVSLGAAGPPTVEGPDGPVKDLVSSALAGMPAGGEHVLRCASLSALSGELRRVGDAAKIASDEQSAWKLVAGYRDAANGDRDPHLQAYAWMTICAATAERNGAGLWLVK